MNKKPDEVAGFWRFKMEEFGVRCDHLDHTFAPKTFNFLLK